MLAKAEKKMKSVRPELDEDSQWILNEFMKLGIYSSHKEVIRAGLEALFQKQMEEEAKTWNESQNDEVLLLQLETE